MPPRSSSSSIIAARLIAIAALTLPGCAAGMSRLKSSVSGQPGMMAMPDLFRMSKAKAIATLELAGHSGDIRWDDQLCGSVVEGTIIEQGEVCRQTPLAGQETYQGTLVTILVQPEDPRHGKVGAFGEWHLMPAVVGMPLDQAKAAMRAAGFTDEHTSVSEESDPACKPRVVCRSYPEALNRAGQSSDRYLVVGVDPPARAVPPARPEREDDPESEAEPPATPPPPKPADTYF